MTRELERLVADAWPRAQAHWSSFLVMGQPVLGQDLPSIAQIHLGTREVQLDSALIRDHGLEDCIEALLAHEVGHHVRYPGTLAVQARLRLTERSIIPFDHCSFINMFTDLMINEYLGVFRGQFARIYRALMERERWQEGPSFMFYMATYEELWQMQPGSLLGECASDFERAFPGFRADAQLLAQDLFHLGPNLYTQFLFFTSVMSRYLQPLSGQTPAHLDPQACSSAEPSAADWADALTLSDQEREAVERAIREGWLKPEAAERLAGRDVRERRIAGLPGSGTADARQVPEIMAAYYRQQAERYLFRVPTRRVMGEAVVPTTTEDWMPGDAVRSIDWLATLRARGDLYGSALPLRRETVADYEGLEQPTERPRIEIYLDVSGSMPNPIVTLNAMTLAAQVLAVGALRAEGSVRALLYSTGFTDLWSWCRSEQEISRFLMHYIGAGTEFPFSKLQESLRSCGNEQPHRVIITDQDFDANFDKRPDAGTIVHDAARLSPCLVLLLHNPEPRRTRQYESLGAKVVAVSDLEDFPGAAAALARVLFERA